MNSISERIVRLRKSKGYGQKEFASMIGVSHVSLSKFENGRTDIIPIGVAKKIADILDISFTELFEIEDSGAEIEKLREKIKSLEITIAGLEVTITSLKTIIEPLNTNRKLVISALVKYVEQKPGNSFYWWALQGFRYAETDKEKEYVELQVKVAKQQRKGIFNYFINEGMLTEKDIKQVQKSIKASYENTDYEHVWKDQFRNLKKNYERILEQYNFNKDTVQNGSESEN